MKEKAVIILSGGMDSTVLAYDKAREYDLYALSFDYGQKQDIELRKASITSSKLDIPHYIMNLKGLGEMVSEVTSNIKTSETDVPEVEDILGDPKPVTYIPNRNAIMLNIAMAHAEAVGASTIFIGIQCHDLYGYWDTTRDFIDRINNVQELNRMETPIVVECPYADMSKTDELNLDKEENLNVPFEDTWTCYDPQGSGPQACGKCGSCAERLNAFAAVGRVDPLIYAAR